MYVETGPAPDEVTWPGKLRNGTDVIGRNVRITPPCVSWPRSLFWFSDRHAAEKCSTTSRCPAETVYVPSVVIPRLTGIVAVKLAYTGCLAGPLTEIGCSSVFPTVTVGTLTTLTFDGVCEANPCGPLCGPCACSAAT